MNPAKVAAHNCEQNLRSPNEERDFIRFRVYEEIIGMAYVPFIQTVKEFVKVVNALDGDEYALDISTKLESMLEEME